MADKDVGWDDGEGIGPDDLPGLMRELFDQCVQDARQVASPTEDPDGFIEALWEQVAAAFALTRRDWPEEAPVPWPALMEEQRAVAEAVLEGRVPPPNQSSG